MESREILNIFISYSHRNEQAKNMLLKHLSSLPSNIRLLSDDNLHPGDDWGKELKKLREKAGIFILLVSVDYLISTAVHEEMRHIISLSSGNEIKVLPVILEPCNWIDSEVSRFQVVPANGTPVSAFTDQSVAYAEVVQAILYLSELPQKTIAMQRITAELKDQTGILDLRDCKLEAVPVEISSMRWLKILMLGDNNIKEIAHMEGLLGLEELDLSHNAIQRIQNLSTLRKLKKLDLSGNQIRNIEFLNSLVNLEQLDLQQNAIERVKGLGRNLKLKVLGISNNQIRYLNKIGHLINLEVLFAARNNLEQIYGLEKLNKLRRVILTANKLMSLRPLKEQIKGGLNVSLSYSFKEEDTGIYIAENKSMAEPPAEVIAKGNSEVIRFFDEADRVGLKDMDVLKLVLVGNSRVGKTNFSEFLRTGKISKVSPSTELLDIQTWISPFKSRKDGPAMVINIFDFGGQDYYHDAHRMFYSHDTAYVLLWEKESNCYQERVDENGGITYENFPLEYWLESINYNLQGKLSSRQQTEGVGAPPIMVVQNKIDTGLGQLNQQELKEKYKNIYTFFDTALLNGQRASIIPEVMQDFIFSVQLAGRKLLAYEYPIISYYINNQLSMEVLSLDDFWQDCKTKINDASVPFEKINADILADILNNMGLVYYDRGERIYTHVGKLNGYIKNIMDLAKKGSDKGLFYTSQVAAIPYYQEILALLSKNNSIIQIGPDTYLAPQFLPHGAETAIQFFLPAFRFHQVMFIYKAYFHKNILLNLFSMYLTGVKIDLEAGVKNFPFWRNGIMISKGEGDDKQIVLVEFEKTTEIGMIHIKTLQPFSKNSLEGAVTRSLEALNKGWTVEKTISINGRQFFNVNELKQGIKENQFMFYKDNNAFSINDFKDMEDFETLPRKLFISYSSKNAEYISRFVTHLQVLKTNGTIEPWYDRMIEPGKKWDESIRREMKNSDLVIFLLSPDFLATDYIMKTELPLAIKQFGNEDSKFFFIELQPCSWEMTELAKFQQTGDPKKPVKNILTIGQHDNDQQWKEVIKVLEERLRKAAPVN